ncbi:MAG: hypothetical protein ABGZ17_26370, partial [Planctomycetaceae bacterium]
MDRSPADSQRVFPMNQLLIAAIAVMLSAGCWSSSERVARHLSPQSTLEAVRVSSVASQDLGRDKRAFLLQNFKQSFSNLETCVISLDATYHAFLSDMISYYGFVKGCAPYGKRNLDANHSVELVFSHDLCGHGAFVDSAGGRWPTGSLPKSVTFTCDQGSAMWLFSPS